MKYPLISVIVPAYNEEKYLPKVLSALKKQTYPNFEIIVIDNNSTDKTPEVAKRYADRVVFEPKQGMISARQRGFFEAKGEIIARTDADTTPPKNWLMQIYEVFEKNSDVVAVTGPGQYYDSGRLVNFFSRLGFCLSIYFTRLLMGHFQLNGPNFAVRTEIAKKVKPHLNDKDVHEDMDLSCHVSCYGKVVFVLSLVMKLSARRFAENPLSIFEYVYRVFKTILLHHPSHKWHKVE